jgi:hypothetical protein
MSPKSKSSPSLFLPPGLPPPTRELRSADSGLALPLSTRAIFNEIVHRLYTINEFTELVYEAVSPEKGSLICRSLAESKVVESRCPRQEDHQIDVRLNFLILCPDLESTLTP